eukprot:c1597_g1_i1 orf=118-294(+)
MQFGKLHSSLRCFISFCFPTVTHFSFNVVWSSSTVFHPLQHGRFLFCLPSTATWSIPV